MSEPSQRYRVVLDTNEVIGAGTVWLERGQPSPDANFSRRVLIRVAQAHVGLYCGKVIGEYLEKLVDLRHPPDRVLKLITYLMGAFVRVEVISRAAPVCPADPDDEIFLLCALDGGAEYLVSEDQALLALKPAYLRPVIGRSTELAPVLGA